MKYEEFAEVKTVWATPHIDVNLAFIARVSNPNNQDNESIEGLLRFMMREGHVSPFDMANVTLEFNTTRDIGRQAIRHSSLKIQEFSQRYSAVEALGDSFLYREFRTQHPTNRQLSVEVPEDDWRHAKWKQMQEFVDIAVSNAYNWCLENGGAKEVARVVLPEGNTPSRLYFNGTIRSWIFYLKSRLDEATQKEHRIIAEMVLEELRKVAPVTMNAFFPVE